MRRIKHCTWCECYAHTKVESTHERKDFEHEERPPARCVRCQHLAHREHIPDPVPELAVDLVARLCARHQPAIALARGEQRAPFETSCLARAPCYYMLHTHISRASSGPALSMPTDAHANPVRACGGGGTSEHNGCGAIVDVENGMRFRMICLHVSHTDMCVQAMAEGLLVGRAKRDQSRGWPGFWTGVALHEVYLRKPPNQCLPVWRMALLRCFRTSPSCLK
jgi:hypothetical protein